MHRVHYKSFNLYLHIYVELLINQIIILRILITDWYDKKIQIMIALLLLTFFNIS